MKRLKQQVSKVLLGLVLGSLALFIGIPSTKQFISSKSQTNSAIVGAPVSKHSLPGGTSSRPAKQQLPPASSANSLVGKQFADSNLPEHSGQSHDEHSHHGAPGGESKTGDSSSVSSNSNPSLVRVSNYTPPKDLLAGKAFEFKPFPEVAYSVEPLRVSEVYRGSKSMLATLYSKGGQEIGEATITVVEKNGELAYSGFFRPENGLIYVLGHDDSGNTVVEELDPSKFPGCGAAREQHTPTPPKASGNNSYATDEAPGDMATAKIENGGEEGAQLGADGANLVEIRLMVIWSTQAQSAAGGAAAIEAKSISAINDANYSYEVSGINIKLIPAYIGPLGAGETGDFTTDLNRITYKDGHYDNILTLRDQYGADLVSMLNNNNQYCGLGWLGRKSQYYERYGFSVTNQYCLAYHTMTHEMGHNMGAHHNPENANGSGAFPYSYGHHFGSYRSVMAYAPGTRTHHLSNPGIQYRGLTTGTSGRNNARTLNEMALTVANWRGETFKLTGYVTDNGFPIEGATVYSSVLGSQTTDASGYYEFPSVAENTAYILTAQDGTSLFDPQPAIGKISNDTEVNFHRVYMNRNQVNACENLKSGNS